MSDRAYHNLNRKVFMISKRRIAEAYRPLCVIRKKLKTKQRLEPEEHYLYLEIALAIIFDGMNPQNFKSKQIMASIFVVSYISKITALGEISEIALQRKISMQKVVIMRHDVLVYLGRGRNRGSFCISYKQLWMSHAPFRVLGFTPKHLMRNRRHRH